MQTKTFNQQLLKACIDNRSKFVEKYEPFKNQFRQVNQEWIHKSIQVFKNILKDNQTPPIRKMQTMRAIKEGLDICQHGFITLVEVQLLPIFIDIARYRKQDKDEGRGRTLFLTGLKGMNQRQETQKIGNSFLRIILEIIQVWAKTKPFCIIQGYQMQEVDSQFMLAYKQLKSQNVTFPSQYTYYKPGQADVLQRNFNDQTLVINQNRQRYVDYYKPILYDGLSQQKKYFNENTQHLIRLYKHGDNFLINDALKVIEYSLLQKQTTPMNKILSLRMLNELFKSGQFNIIHFANKLTPSLVQQINNFNMNDNSLRRGETFLTGELGKKYSPVYYSQLLKSIQLWSSCVPNDISGKSSQSEFAIGYQKLKQQRKLQFPKLGSTQFSSYKQQFIKNYQKNQIKNQLMRQIHIDASIEIPGSLKNTSVNSKQLQQQSSFVNKNNKKSSSSMILGIPQFQTQTLHQKNQTVKNIYSQMQQLKSNNESLNKQWLAGSISYIGKYCDLNPSLLGSSQINKISIDNLDRAEKVLGLYDRYLDQEIPYNEFLIQVKKTTKGSYLSPMQSDINQNINNIPRVQNKMLKQQIIPVAINNNFHQMNQIPQVNHMNQMNNNFYELNNQYAQMNNQMSNQMSNQMNQQPSKAFNQTINKTAQFLPGLSSEKSIQQQIQYQNYQNYNPYQQENMMYQQVQQIQYHEPNAFIPPVPQIPVPQTPIYALSPRSSDMSLDIVKKNSLNQQDNRKKIPPTLVQGRKQQSYELRRYDQQPSSKQNISIARKDQRSQTMSDAFRSKQRITLEGFQNNLLDSKLSLLNKQDSQKRIQSSVSLKNLNIGNKSNSHQNHPTTSMPPRSMSPPILNSQRPPLPPPITPPRIQQKQVFDHFSPPQPQSHLKQFNLDSKPSSSHQRLNQPQIIHYNNIQHDSRILQPSLQPLNNSYYDIDQIKYQSLQSHSDNFRNVFDSNKYYVGNVPNNKMWLQKDAVILKTNQDRSKINLPSALSDIELHHRQQIQNMQEHYLRIIRTLQNKIKTLQNKLEQIQNTNQGLSRVIQSVKGSMSVSRYVNGTDGIKMSMLDEQVKAISRNLKQPVGRRYNQEKYKVNLFSINDTKTKKIMLKNKELLFKNSSIQIGCMVSKDVDLKIVLYVLSDRNLINFNAKINNPGGLIYKIHPRDMFKYIEAQKQQKIVITINSPSLNQLPLQNLSLQFTFEQPNSNQINSFHVLLPATMNRFVDYQQLRNINSFNNIFQNTDQIYRTQEYLINTKILKQSSAIKSLLPKFVLVTPDNDFSQGMDLIYGAEALFNNYRFLVRCVIRPTNCLYWQGLDPIQKCPQVVLHSFLTTMAYLMSH